MSKLTPIIESLASADYIGKRQLLEFLLRAVHGTKGKLETTEREAILAYAYGEIDVFMKDILSAKTYKEKDLIFECGDALLRLVMLLCPDPSQIPASNMVKLNAFVQLANSERYLEVALERMFEKDTIEEIHINHLLSHASKAQDEYQKGKLYGGLVHFSSSISKMQPTAKNAMAAYFEKELCRYLSQPDLTEDELNNLELLADVCKHFATQEIITLLGKVMELGHSNINFYAVGSLLSLNKAVPGGIISALAGDLEFANITYALLSKHGKQSYFPKELVNPEYLAKSDMVRWLTYPTELGKAPDEIEYVGKIGYLFKKEVYYVFKYRSHSDTLGEELKNKWLIGWSSEDGGTFSNFDLYEQYEGKTVEKTLSNIKNKLIGR